MKGKKQTPERIIAKLREAEAELNGGNTMGQVCQKLAVSERTHHRWRNEYGGMKSSAAKRLKDLAEENRRLKQAVGDRLGMAVHVSHFPPGASKWNKIEHRMFCHITQNWRGRPLIIHEVIIHLIANTTTQQGLKIKAEMDRGIHPTGIKAGDEQLAAVNLRPAKIHGEWNYGVPPSRKSQSRHCVAGPYRVTTHEFFNPLDSTPP